VRRLKAIPLQLSACWNPISQETRRRVAHVSTPDGDAEVYRLGGDGLMITHASGEFIWQVMVDVAVAGGYVIMPVGCAPCALCTRK
jgi:hypothetical protein